ADAFAAYYRLKELRRITEAAWSRMAVMVTPTAGRHYTIAELLADPIRLNSNLGYYTNFMNLLDLSGVAIPAGFQKDGLPFGATLPALRLAGGAAGAAGHASGRAGQGNRGRGLGVAGIGLWQLCRWHPIAAGNRHSRARRRRKGQRLHVRGLWHDQCAGHHRAG